tara:strand:- start:278 stop:580 length:303 start_codon:yes stop_codon:yes gene_type:complete
MFIINYNDINFINKEENHMINLIKKKLLKEFNPEYLEVIDESSKHLGHSGYTEGKISHIEIIIKSEKFNEMSRVDIHRLINNALREEWENGIHAVSIKIK